MLPANTTANHQQMLAFTMNIHLLFDLYNDRLITFCLKKSAPGGI
jgi:hypothetical protein